MSERCQAITNAKRQCSRPVVDGGRFCGQHEREINGQEFNTCPRCGLPVPAPFKAHVDNLGGCPSGADQ